MSNIIIAILGGICGFAAVSVWSGICTHKGYSKLVEWIGYGIMLVCVYFCCFRTPSFTGNPHKDAKILYERIYIDGEYSSDVIDELFEHYAKKGYGMENAKEAINICSEM